MRVALPKVAHLRRQLETAPNCAERSRRSPAKAVPVPGGHVVSRFEFCQPDSSAACAEVPISVGDGNYAPISNARREVGDVRCC